MATVQKITPCLWFDDQAEAAATFYTSVFNDSKIMRVSRLRQDVRSTTDHPDR